MNKLQSIYRQLLTEYKQQGWWPFSRLSMPVKKGDKDWANYKKFLRNSSAADFRINWPRHHGIAPKKDSQRLEIIIGALLTQNTSWRNVEKAIYILNKDKLLDRKKLSKLPFKKLSSLIKSAGYYNQKARKIKEFLRFKGKITRENLLSIWGIGPETADSILLYAYNKPIFVIDAYTRRIMFRVGICKSDAKYGELQKIFHNSLNCSAKLFKEYHALLVQHAQTHCKTKPVCNSCPISKLCASKR